MKHDYFQDGRDMGELIFEHDPQRFRLEDASEFVRGVMAEVILRVRDREEEGGPWK